MDRAEFRILPAATLLSILALTSICHAEPCKARLDALQRQVDSVLESDAAQGRSARETTDATMHRQPTPKSMAADEEALGELSTRKVDAFRSALTLARQAESAGRESDCQKAADAAEALLVRNK